MIKNYLKIAFRNLGRNKGFSAINILGLSIGMSAAILIFLWVQNELGTDRFFDKTTRLYQLCNRDRFQGGMRAGYSTPSIMAGTLKQEYPEVEDVSRYRNVTFLVSAGETHLNTQGAFADSSFLKLFSFPLLEGNPGNSLTGSYDIVLTEKLAKKLFGYEPAIGKTVRIDSNANFTVRAVLKDLPSNTTFDFEYLLPWSFRKSIGWESNGWGDNEVYTYVLLKKGVSQASFDSKVENITIRHSDETPKVFTQAVSRIYLYSRDDNGKLIAGRVELVRLFIIIGFFILFIACINFMNLSTARSEKRAREVGVRKVMGARKISLVRQFILESILLSLLSFLLALFMVTISLDAFNLLTGKNLAIDYSNPVNWIYGCGFILFTGFLAGSYPAFFLSSFKPVKVLKGNIRTINTFITPRKVLVVVQFTFAI